MKNGTITVPADRPWGWDYFQNYITTYYGAPVYYADYFPSGGGGGVSVNFDMPRYQAKVPGTQLSAANQSLICQTSTGSQDYSDLPAGYAGRNVPDISLNADPFTGYSLYSGGVWASEWGGTSFVAPQLNGIAALLSQASNSRLGHLNPQLYARLKQYGYANNSPFKAITSGDNLYWQATQSYNPASGIGALNVNNLVRSFGYGNN
jgi:subtilase family serine protease